MKMSKRARRGYGAGNDTRRRRIHTISFDPIEDEWLNAIIEILAAEGHPKAARSEVVRVALTGLREALADHTRAAIVRFFVQRDADRLFAALDSTTRRLPFD
jgi:hypothetical protein